MVKIIVINACIFLQTSFSCAVLASNTFFMPQTKEELIFLVQSAAAKSEKITPCGSFGSYKECTGGAYADQKYVHLGHLNSILWINKTTNQVCVEAGILLEDLIRELAKADLQLIDHVATQGLSLVGTLSTGSHGASLIGYLPDYIEEIEFIDGTGTVHRCSRTTSPELLRAICVGLGCFGIIYSITINCQKLEYVTQHIQYIYVDNFCEVMKHYLDNCIALRGELNPYTGLIRLQTVYPVSQSNISSSHNAYYASHRIAYQLQDKIIIGTVRDLAKKYAWKEAVAMAIDRHILLRNHHDFTDIYPYVMAPFDYRILRSNPLTLARLNEEEFAIPLKHFTEALYDVIELFQELAHNNIYNVRQITFRFSKGTNNAYLGPVGEGIWGWINIVLIHSRFGHVIENNFKLFADGTTNAYFQEVTAGILETLEDKFIGLYNARPHWGKNNYLTLTKLRRIYGDNAVNTFINLRKKHDPKNIFLKPYTHKLFA
ncbi:MAG TPA: FAD-binding protein [Patescibacteria group bacterium]|jgi:FAD/FMN-containing dehydrogenase|nr:FAD-binding protein [Patescibacteria group bacterium]